MKHDKKIQWEKTNISPLWGRSKFWGYSLTFTSKLHKFHKRNICPIFLQILNYAWNDNKIYISPPSSNPKIILNIPYFNFLSKTHAHLWFRTIMPYPRGFRVTCQYFISSKLRHIDQCIFGKHLATLTENLKTFNGSKFCHDIDEIIFCALVESNLNICLQGHQLDVVRNVALSTIAYAGLYRLAQFGLDPGLLSECRPFFDSKAEWVEIKTGKNSGDNCTLREYYREEMGTGQVCYIKAILKFCYHGGWRGFANFLPLESIFWSI